MARALTVRDLFRLLLPTKCFVEALSMSVLLVSISGCTLAVLPTYPTTPSRRL